LALETVRESEGGAGNKKNEIFKRTLRIFADTLWGTIRDVNLGAVTPWKGLERVGRGVPW